MNVYDPLFLKNYVRIVVSKPDLYSAFFCRVTDFPPHSADLNPLLLQILVE